MSQNLVINDVIYNNVDSLSLVNDKGDTVLYKEDAGSSDDFSELSTVLNRYTGESSNMSMEEIINKVDTLLKAFTDDRSEFRYKFYYAQNVTNFPMLDTSQATSLSYMYYYCDNVNAVFPWIDSSNCISFDYIYYRVKAKQLPVINTSKGTNFDRSLYGCTNLQNFPFSDTSNGQNFNRMCDSCNKLTSVKLNLSKATNVTNILYNCKALVDLDIEGTIYITGLDLSSCTALSHDSLMNVINALADYSSDTSGKVYHLILGPTNLAKLNDDEKAIATNKKRWTLS